MLRSFLLAVGFLGVSVASLHAQEEFLGKSAKAWITQLKQGATANERRNAAFALGKMGDRIGHLVPDMKQVLRQEKESKVRESLLFALGDICKENVGLFKLDRDLEQLFLDGLKDSDPYVRRSATYALGYLGNPTPAVLAALDQALSDENPRVRQNAAWAFGKLGRALGVQGAAVLPYLQKALRDADSLVKRDAASALLQIRDPEKVQELVKDLHPLCRDSNSEVRRAALDVLARVVNDKNRDAIPNLNSALQDRDLEIRRNAALAMSNIGGEEAVAALPVLLEAARNGNAELRPMAVLAIRRIGPAAASAVPELIRFLREDKDDTVRLYAALALGGIGKASEPAFPLLVEKLGDSGEKLPIRAECVMTMARIGLVPAAKDAVPSLLAILADPKTDARVRHRIPYVLRKHGANLPSLNNTLETFVKVLKEPPIDSTEFRLLRYETAYTLGVHWRNDAPDITLDVLSQWLQDKSIKLFDKTDSAVGPSSSETKSGVAIVKERTKGDGRVMAADALADIGFPRYRQRMDIMKQLDALSKDNTIYEPLQKKAAELLTK